VSTTARPPTSRLDDDPEPAPVTPVAVNPGGPTFEIRESKLRPLALRPGLVDRTKLLPRLQLADSPVTTVIAPAGYGKTTLLAQFAALHQTPVAWLSADDADNDPAVLCTYLAVAFDRIEPIDGAVFAALGAHRPTVVLVTRLLAAPEALTQPVALAIDQLDNVTNVECLEVIGEIASRLPSGARLVVCSREQIRLPTARLRVEGRLLELDARDLALDRDEAAGLLQGAGVSPASADVEELVARTEGWPAGLFLAALSLQVGTPRTEAGAGLSGDSRFLADYLRAEVLDRASAEDVPFLIQTSVLESLSGALCDATLDTVGSSARLDELERRNLWLVPLDDRRESYRYHRLFGELLRAELQRRQPELLPILHARAADWYRDNGQPEQALRHAQAANDADRVAHLLLDLIQPVWASGRAETVMRWLEWFADEDLLGRYPGLTVHGALMYALLGRPAEADTWAAAAERSLVLSDLPDGSSIESLRAYLRAFQCRDGVAAMRADSVSSYEGLSPTSPYRASMLYTEGLSYAIAGDPNAAGPVLARAFDAAVAVGAVPLAALVLAVWSQTAAQRDDWAEATELGERALALLGDGSFDEYWTSALVFAWGSRLAVRSGQREAATAHLARAARLRPLLTYALPAVSVEALIQMAHTYVALGDHSGASTVLRQAHEILRQRPDLGVLGGQVEQLRGTLEHPVVSSGGSSLTAAELRLVPLLATHLTLQEIGDRLFIARSTVKTQAISVYRKLGVSSRSEAVDKLHELGLLVT
jgi:LuxR family maltose regulon positive regulatory protein